MRLIYMLLAAIILVLVAANVYYYINIYNQQVNFQKDMLTSQTEICSWEIEHHTANFLNEINYILFSEDISRFFSNAQTMESSSMKIGIFFSKYKKLITSISLYDNEKNVYNIFKDRSNNLGTDIYVSREQRELYEKEKLEELEDEYIFIIPAFKNNLLLANLIIKIDTREYVESVFTNYHIDKTLWPWMITKEGEIVFSTLDTELLNVGDIELLAGEWPELKETGTIFHKLGTGENVISVISTYYPIKVLYHDMLVVFSLDTGIVVSSILTSIITISAATFIVLILIIVIFLYFIRNERREKQKSREAEQAIKDIFESLPMGIIIKDLEGHIRMINSTALGILRIEDAGNLIGKDISDMFFLFRDYSDSSRTRQRESTNEYVYYDPDDNEIILYKKEILASFLGDEVLVEAFIDISPIEKARKSEFLFGEAKTEFLKRVSHDIRNPLNGIMNIVDSLESDMGPGPSETEKLGLIRRCCDDILLVVNDIMDFSGFEAGNTLVEEVPFVLADEINLAVSPLTNKAREKNISITTTIDDNVPDILIGDPFHIRQVLTNLLSNSLKYTREGEISISAGTKKQVEGNILLEFTIEDTGIGISPTLLENLNQNSNAWSSMPEGNFGLKKTKQLISLLKGDIRIESPVAVKNEAGGPGTRVIFHVQVYSNEITGKILQSAHIKSYKDIRTLILAEPDEKKPEIKKILLKLGLPCETTSYNESTIDFIKSRMGDPASGFSVILIIDSSKSNGFSIARNIYENHLNKRFLIIIISSVNKPGNFMKSRRFGADHYLIEPFEGSEIFDIIQNSFPNIAIPALKKGSLKKVMPDLKILVAEDNHVNQIVAKSLFKSLGYDIDVASNGREALKKVGEKDYDIVFMDIRMPEKNGLDATYEIRNLGYTMPIVAMTANASETDKTRAMETGMTDFIAKPVRIDILKNIIIKKFSK